MTDARTTPDPRYPGKRYHATVAPVYVQSAADEKALGPGWFDSPKKAAAAPAKPAKPATPAKE